MQRWEYLESYWDNGVLKRVDGVAVPRDDQKSIQRRQWLADRGEEGWELVTTFGAAWVFKRPKE